MNTTDIPTIDLAEAVELAALHRYGNYDFAVPDPWRLENKGTIAVWIYRRRSGIIGEPLPFLTILRLARRKCSGDPLLTAAINNTISILNPAKLTAQKLISLLNA